MAFDAFAALTTTGILESSAGAAGMGASGNTWRQRRAAALYLSDVCHGEPREVWRNRYDAHLVKTPSLEPYLASPSINLFVLPLYSTVVQFTLTLAQPYLSHDDQEFSIVVNPVRKDKMSGTPYVAPSTWKGSLRQSSRQLGLSDKDEVHIRLFGNPKDADAEFQAGRLHFFPTFFQEQALQMINPHDRRDNVGSDPIPIECVPKDAQGTFTLLYAPDDVGKPDDVRRARAAADLQALGNVMHGLFTIYGFGAKTSDGFGLAADKITDGALHIRLAPNGLRSEGVASLGALKDMLKDIVDATVVGSM